MALSNRLRLAQRDGALPPRCPNYAGRDLPAVSRVTGRDFLTSAPQLVWRDAKLAAEGCSHVALMSEAGFESDLAQRQGTADDQRLGIGDAAAEDIGVRRAAKAGLEQRFKTR